MRGRRPPRLIAWRAVRTTSDASDRSPGPGENLRDLAVLFLRLGVTGFGGPAAHIAMMQDEVVTRRRWITPAEFLDLLGATSLIPGPNSTELAIHIGQRRGGLRGLVVAGVCFIVPAASISAGIAWMYVRYGNLPQVAGVLYGVKPVIIAVVVQAIWILGRSALTTSLAIVVATLCLVARVGGAHELLIILGAGAVVASARGWARGSTAGVILGGVHAIPLASAAATSAAAGAAPISLFQLASVFLKIGSTLFGSGYVLLAFLRADFVERLGWLTERQLLDAVAVGQLTPGPVLSTATFVGYVIGGGAGAVVSTVAIFAPAFILVALSGLLVPRIRRSSAARSFLDGVNVASLAVMAAVSWELGWAALVDPLTILMASVSALLLVRYRVNSAWLVLGGAALGFVVNR
jgi:chromate transporter